MSEIPVSRLFSMGAFEGLRTIRLSWSDFLPSPPDETIALLRRVDADASALDLDAAIELHAVVRTGADPGVAHQFYRCCISDLLRAHDLSWARSIMYGRDRLLTQLGRDEKQCFRDARLLGKPPTDDVLAWWFDLAQQIRFANNLAKADQGLRGERLSLAHEQTRLASLGVPESPEWVSFEDNTAGYDILSYDLAPQGLTNRLIEVKTTIASPLRFYLSRNEWKHALQFGASYHFHIWDMSACPPRLHERTMEEILPHIPVDQSKGRWDVALIPLGTR